MSRFMTAVLVWMFCGHLLAAETTISGENYRLSGQAVQGGMMVGSTSPGSQVFQDGQALRVSAQGDFLLGFTRDAPADSALSIKLPSSPPFSFQRIAHGRNLSCIQPNTSRFLQNRKT